jgi:hypothetical protein
VDGHSQSFEEPIRIARYKIVMQLSIKETPLEPDCLSYACSMLEAFC